MSDTSVVGGSQTIRDPSNPAFVDAITRARKIASKINPDSVGLKRPPVDELGSFDGVPEYKKEARNMMEGGPPSLDGSTVSSGAMSETIIVPDKMVGLIIGRGGEQISRLQAESGCKIQMAQDSQGMNERSCTLTGNPQNIAQAKQAIDRIIANEGTGGLGGPPHRPMMGGLGSGGNAGFYEMNVPGQKVGLIIGKGGDTIKQLQEQSGAKIVIIQEGPEAALEKPLRITGAPDSVEMAKQLVAEILNQDQDRDMGGFGGQGRGRGRGRGMGGARGGFMGRGGGRGGRGAYGGTQWGAPHGGGEYGATHTDYITIPTNKCGLVIGKGGETIKNINSTAGVHCEVDKNAPPDAREKNFVIRGPPDAVERAKQMILEKVGMQSNGGGYGGGGGNGYAGNGGGWVNNSSGGQYPTSSYAADPGMPAPSGTADYSAQWADYYRSMGMVREAEAIEKHIGSARSANGMGSVAPQSTQQPNNGAGSNTADYSIQWADYYRSIGKIKEAEAIEQQIKNKAASASGPPANSQGYPLPYGGYYGGSQPGQPSGAASGYPTAQSTGYSGYHGYPPGQES